MSDVQLGKAIKLVVKHAAIAAGASLAFDGLVAIIEKFKGRDFSHDTHQYIHVGKMVVHGVADLTLLEEIGHIYGFSKDQTNHTLLQCGLIGTSNAGIFITDVGYTVLLELNDPKLKNVLHAAGRSAITVAAGIVFALICEAVYG
jgi:hypothetical protein